MKRPPTFFEQRVYGLTRRIPRGRVCTYAELAKAAGCGSARAVGQALSRNPDAPAVPCHRVIGSSLRIGGFMGCAEGMEIRRKRDLLAAEGVEFKDGRLADKDRLFRF